MMQNLILNQTIRDIKELRIQGAQQIAKSVVRAFAHAQEEYFAYYHHMGDYAKALKNAKDQLAQTRPTEPLLRNCLHILFHDTDILYYNTMPKLHEHIQSQLKFVNSHFQNVFDKVSYFTSQKIQTNMNVYTHCHSSAVVESLIRAKGQKKRITVLNTETRPRFQGRITATELSKQKIPVEHYVDSALRLAIKKADIVLLGADAIDYKGRIYNKIGSELICEIAKLYRVPVYICTDSWKFDPLTDAAHEEIIELRDSKEVWDKAPKNVTIKNYAFEKINPVLVQGIISELGILKPSVFLQKVKETYPILTK